MHPAAADVQRLLDRLEVEPAEKQPALGVLEGRETACAPGLERERRDLLVGGGCGARGDVAHLLEARVRVVDVRLLGRKIGVAHASSVAK